MDIQTELILSYYKEIATLNAEHRIVYVQHTKTKQIYIKKTLDVFNLNVYSYLKNNPVSGVPKIYEVIPDKDTLIVIEEYVSGRSLEQILETEGPLSEERAAKYILQLCDTLSRLHSSVPSIIHRDIKPTNVIITPCDNVMLIDLNAAKHASDKNEDTTLLGTRGYAAPEQYGFGSSGIQTDIYAIGMLMNTMLNGSFSQEIVESKYSSIIKKCTELTPENRYSSIDDLKRALHNRSNGLSISYDTDNKRSLLLPGFRSGNYANMAAASAYYIFIAWLSFDMTFKDSGPAATYIQRIGVFLILLSLPFNIMNYANIHSKFPLCNSANPVRKVLGIILLNLTVIFSLLFSMLVLVAILNK